jgi:hypothetical protein
MSSGTGEGTGASLQDNETNILRRDDAETIAETLAEVSRMVIEWHFGRGVEPLARVELVVPVAEDSAKVIQSGLALAAAGASVSVSALMERAGIPAAKDDSDRLGGNLNRLPVRGTQTGQDAKGAKDGIEAVANAGDSTSTDKSQIESSEPPAWLAAMADDLQPLGKALESAMAAGDDSAMRAALKKISADMPDFMASPGLETALAKQFTQALTTES